MSDEFKGHHASFSKCVERILKVVKGTELESCTKIFTSKDKEVQEAIKQLRVKEILNGFYKWQLPVFFSDGVVIWITIGNPEAVIHDCQHDNGSGFKFIGCGSIVYNDIELTAGDWMYIPKGEKYSFQVGKFGATMLYCYECCAY